MIFSVFRAAEEAPDRPALVGPEEVLTYRALAERVRARLPSLRARAATPGRPFPLEAAADLDTAVSLLALFEAGVPAAPIDRRWPGAERAAAAARLGDPAAPIPLPEAGPESPMAVLFTSGSGGAPKAAVLARRAFAAAARASAARLGWSERDRFLLCLSPARIGGLSVLTRSLAARATTVVCPRFRPREVAALLAAERVTAVSLVPTMLRDLLDADPAWRPPRSLRLVLLGGAAAPPALLERAAARGLPVARAYGATETCAHVAVAAPGAGPDEGCGRPLDGVTVALRSGRIAVRGPTLFSGYLQAGRLAGGPDAEGFWDTADLGRIDAAGRLHVLGRADETILSGGECVSPAEVEFALGRCSGIAEALVFGVPDERWGELVAAAIVPAGPGPDRAALVRHLAEVLRPAARPRRIAIVDRLPLTSAGKPDRRGALRALRDRLEPLS